MRKLVCVVTMSALLGAMPWTSKAATKSSAKTYSNLFVFGDSYCDVGNDFLASGGAVPAAPYYQGRFSNGPIWIEHVAGFLGLGALTPSQAGGTDYAFGGAEVTQSVPTQWGTIPSVPQQVAMYLNSTGGVADPDALYVIEGGGNDILNSIPGTPKQVGREIAEGIAQSEQTLRQAGARHFLIPDMINIAGIPAGLPNAPFNVVASQAVNTELAKLLKPERSLPGVQIIRVDVYNLGMALLADPDHFAFNHDDPCTSLPSVQNPYPSVCADPDHDIFWDLQHLTEFGQNYLAVAAEVSLTAKGW